MSITTPIMSFIRTEAALIGKENLFDTGMTLWPFELNNITDLLKSGSKFLP